MNNDIPKDWDPISDLLEAKRKIAEFKDYCQKDPTINRRIPCKCNECGNLTFFIFMGYNDPNCEDITANDTIDVQCSSCGKIEYGWII